MARVEVSRRAAENLERLILTHSLPPDTRERVRRSLRHLESFPLLGAPLSDKWSGMRYVLGPWRWMLLVYSFEEQDDSVVVVTIQDGRSSRIPVA